MKSGDDGEVNQNSLTLQQSSLFFYTSVIA